MNDQLAEQFPLQNTNPTVLTDQTTPQDPNCQREQKQHQSATDNPRIRQWRALQQVQLIFDTWPLLALILLYTRTSELLLRSSQSK
jgi:hypothetical protein